MDPAGLPELVGLLRMPAAEVRRLAASAMGKLADFAADPQAAVAALMPVALRDPHPQVQQYALKALKNYGPAAEGQLHDLDYRIGMLEKKKLYQQAGKRLLSLYARDKPNLRRLLREGLARQPRPALGNPTRKKEN